MSVHRLPSRAAQLLAELRELIQVHEAQGRPADAVLQFAVVTAPTAPVSSIAEPTLAVVAQGMKRLAIGEEVYDYGPGEYVVVTVDLPVTGFFSDASRDEPFLGVGLRLRPDVIASLLVEGDLSRAHARALAGVGVATASVELLDAVVRMARLLGKPGDLQVLQPLVEREILWRLLNGEHGDRVRQIGLADSSLSHIGRAVSWIRSHYAEPFRVEDLADQAGLSVSAFHRQFRAVTMMTPIQFQKKIRLQQARLLLVSRAENVTGAGYAVGYDSPSQFSREYRREFGLAPGQDAFKLRAEAELLPAMIP